MEMQVRLHQEVATRKMVDVKCCHALYYAGAIEYLVCVLSSRTDPPLFHTCRVVHNVFSQELQVGQLANSHDDGDVLQNTIPGVGLVWSSEHHPVQTKCAA